LFGENHNYLGIDKSHKYIYYSPKSTFAFLDSFCLEFDKKISEKGCISIYIEIENGTLIKEEIIESPENIENKIIDFIYDDYFVPISRKPERLLIDLEYEKNSLNGLNEKKITENIYYYSKEYIKLAKKLVDDNKKYYAIPIYFTCAKFEDLDIKKFKFKKNDNEIIDFIKFKILSKEEWKLWNLCSTITNNAIHKNNYDFENFEGWWISENEIEIIIKIIEVFFNTLIKYNKYKTLEK